MTTEIRAYAENDLDQIRSIWNDVVKSGVSFHQLEPLSDKQAEAFFAEQSRTAVAVIDDEVVGLYILHPNYVGRCGHIANSSYAVKVGFRGQHIGEHLVKDSLQAAKDLGFQILQFNSVVASNKAALHLYLKLGFKPLGAIPGGFRMPDGRYEDIIPFYYVLTEFVGESQQDSI